jgi:uncharacterized protein YbaR (Trm112 family)
MPERRYYCLVAGLPDLLFDDHKTVVDMAEMRLMLKGELHPDDNQLVDLLFCPVDHQNILNAVYHTSGVFLEGGNLSHEDIALLIDKRLLDEPFHIDAPPYLIHVVREALIANELVDIKVFKQRLLDAFTDVMVHHSNSFLRTYGMFDRNMRNLFTALNGRKYHQDVNHILAGDGDIVEALRKSKSRDFGLHAEMEHLETLLQYFETDDLLARELKVDALKWRFIDDAAFFYYFTIENVLAFVLKLMIASRWLRLNEQTGRQLFRELISTIQSGYEFPEQFNISHGRKT